MSPKRAERLRDVDGVLAQRVGQQQGRHHRVVHAEPIGLQAERGTRTPSPVTVVLPLLPVTFAVSTRPPSAPSPLRVTVIDGQRAHPERAADGAGRDRGGPVVVRRRRVAEVLAPRGSRRRPSSRRWTSCTRPRPPRRSLVSTLALVEVTAVLLRGSSIEVPFRPAPVVDLAALGVADLGPGVPVGRRRVGPGGHRLGLQRRHPLAAGGVAPGGRRLARHHAAQVVVHADGVRPPGSPRRR